MNTNKIILALVALAAFSGLANAAGPRVVIYNNEACGHCQPYIAGLMDGLESIGINDFEVRRLINNASVRAELSQLQASRGVPLEMQGHLVVAVDGKYLFEGHVPTQLVTQFLSQRAKDYPDGIVVTQDSMSDAPTYLMMVDGQIREFAIGQPIGSADGAASPSGGYGSYALPALIVLIPLALLFFGGVLND